MVFVEWKFSMPATILLFMCLVHIMHEQKITPGNSPTRLLPMFLVVFSKTGRTKEFHKPCRCHGCKQDVHSKYAGGDALHRRPN